MQCNIICSLPPSPKPAITLETTESTSDRFDRQRSQSLYIFLNVSKYMQTFIHTKWSHSWKEAEHMMPLAQLVDGIQQRYRKSTKENIRYRGDSGAAIRNTKS